MAIFPQLVQIFPARSSRRVKTNTNGHWPTKPNTMSKYMFLFRGGEPGIDPMSDPAGFGAYMMTWKTWMENLAKTGKYLGGDPLEAKGRTITGKQMKMTDGPFVEGKEIVGGYVIVEAASLDEAVALSKGCPIYTYDGVVEVRPVQHVDF